MIQTMPHRPTDTMVRIRDLTHRADRGLAHVSTRRNGQVVPVDAFSGGQPRTPRGCSRSSRARPQEAAPATPARGDSMRAGDRPPRRSFAFYAGVSRPSVLRRPGRGTDTRDR
jgi:hypothetical protein